VERPWIIYTDLDTSWFLGGFGECQVMGQPMGTRWLVAPLIYRDFRNGSLQLARGHQTSATLNHQIWPRAHIILQYSSHQHTTGAIFSYDRLSMSGMMRGDAAPRFRVSAQNAP
jgi:hypothetical protein